MSEAGRAEAEARAEPSAGLGPYLRQLWPALAGLALLTLITGLVYPAIVYGVGRLAFPDQADGGLLSRGGVVVGSRLIGQPFSQAQYFQPRPSAAGAGYDATQSGGTNLAPSNPKLIGAVRDAAAAYRALNGLAADAPAPIDAVTSSASGLDPQRVARARGVSLALVSRLVAEHTQGPDFGLLGQPRVSVLELNLALDAAAPMRVAK
jgi:K+-transporting ATPase ATPase C chain